MQRQCNEIVGITIFNERSDAKDQGKDRVADEQSPWRFWPFERCEDARAEGQLECVEDQESSKLHAKDASTTTEVVPKDNARGEVEKECHVEGHVAGER